VPEVHERVFLKVIMDVPSSKTFEMGPNISKTAIDGRAVNS
jgi:hypothetical protein